MAFAYVKKKCQLNRGYENGWSWNGKYCLIANDIFSTLVIRTYGNFIAILNYASVEKRSWPQKMRINAFNPKSTTDKYLQ